MGLFKWFKKKQVEAEGTLSYQKAIGFSNQRDVTEPYDPLLPDGDRTGMVPEKPEFKVKAVLSGTTLTAFLPGGDTVITNHGTHLMLTQIVNAKSEWEVRNIMLDEGSPEIAKSDLQANLIQDEIKNVLPEFLSTGEFESKNELLFLKGIDLPIPALLAREILKAAQAAQAETSDYYDALKNFWCWCAANEDPVARQDTFGFLERGDFKITKRGFFIGFRNVTKMRGKSNESKALVEFISAKYVNVKTKQKKSPKDFVIYEDGPSFGKDFYGVAKIGAIPSLPKTANVIGNLADLYANLGDLEENIYTDDYTKKMKIKIGEPVKMDRKDCDNDPHSSCSRGLHIKNKKFGHDNDFGGVSLVCIVNPMNVVAVPKSENNKMRVCEYFPLAVVEGKWSDWLEDADTLQLEDEYLSMEVDNLLELASKAKPGSLLIQVATTVEDYQRAIEDRIVKV